MTVTKTKKLLLRAGLENQRRITKKREREYRAKESSDDAAAATDYSKLNVIFRLIKKKKTFLLLCG